MKIKVKITTEKREPPKGVLFDHLDVDCKDASGASSNQAVAGVNPECTFDVSVGQGLIVVTARDTQGNQIGVSVQFSFDIKDQNIVLFDAPVGVSVEVLP